MLFCATQYWEFTYFPIPTLNGDRTEKNKLPFCSKHTFFLEDKTLNSCIVSWGCQDKFSQAGLLHTIKIYCLKILEARNWNKTGPCSLGGLQAKYLHASLSLWWLLETLSIPLFEDASPQFLFPFITWYSPCVCVSVLSCNSAFSEVVHSPSFILIFKPVPQCYTCVIW